MRRLLELISQFRNLLLFLALEGVAFWLVVSYNSQQGSVFQAFTHRFVNGVEELNHSIVSYFNLGQVNDALQADLMALRVQNDSLRAQVAYLRHTIPQSASYYAYGDTLRPSVAFRYIPARILENTLTGSYNYVVLNVGKAHGVRPEMGIITATGVAGIVSHVSDNYSLGLSLLNRNVRISARIKGKEILGTFTWSGGSIRMGTMQFVPLHYQPSRGDTIVTSNFSTLFPEGFILGTIHSIQESEQNGFYDIEVKLATDFGSLDYVYVTENRNRPEIDSLLVRANPS
jgi:rod shape-determining protein MreC